MSPPADDQSNSHNYSNCRSESSEQVGDELVSHHEGVAQAVVRLPPQQEEGEIYKTLNIKNPVDVLINRMSEHEENLNDSESSDRVEDDRDKPEESPDDNVKEDPDNTRENSSLDATKENNNLIERDYEFYLITSF